MQLQYDNNGKMIFEILSTIEEKEEFLNDFSQIPCYLRSPPSGVELGKTAIKFSYQNGESELVNEYGRTMFLYEFDGGEILGFTGSHYLNEGGYNTLIRKYSKQVE